jgi:hypothetical protein
VKSDLGAGGSNRTKVVAGPYLPALHFDSWQWQAPIFRVGVQFNEWFATGAESIEVSVGMGTETTDSLFFDPASIGGGGGMFQLAMPLDASSLNEGGYESEMSIVADTGTSTPTGTASGFFFVEPEVDGPFGPGWTMDGLDWATITNDAVSIGTGDGNRIWFSKQGSDYIAESGDPFRMTLVENVDGSFTLTDHLGNESNFDEDGLLVSRIDASGNQTTYDYIDADSDTQVDDISLITDPAGREIEFTYTSGLVTPTSPAA